METIAARLSSKYQVVIPKVVRDRLRLEPRSTILFLIEGETVILRPRPDDFTGTLRGLHQRLWPDPDAWLEEERSTWE